MNGQPAQSSQFGVSFSRSAEATVAALRAAARTLLAHVRATAIAMSSQGFESVYENALDSLTGDTEQDLYVRIVLEMQQAEVASL